MIQPLHLFVTCARGLGDLLVEELQALGAASTREQPGGVACTGDLEFAYRACLWSRVASRVLLLLAEVPAADEQSLYRQVRELPWEDHLDVDGTLAVDAVVRRSSIGHSKFAALRVKDAVVDRFRSRTERRPSVDVERPDLRINLHLDRDRARVSIDLSGASLHQRGYRLERVMAPLKENLAAAILLRARWPEIAAAGGALVDPMCGSGTLVIEAALMAGDCAPGLTRDYYGFLGWRCHNGALWQRLREEARTRCTRGLERVPPIVGCDMARAAVNAALANLERAGLSGRVHVERRALADCRPPAGAPGLVVTNPPYGERLGDKDQLEPLYAELGGLLKSQFHGWQAAVFTGNPELGLALGLRARRSNTLFNGPIECRLLQFAVEPQTFVERGMGPRPAAAEALGAGAAMLANRLRKNQRELGRWARREGVECYRLYDADLPEYAVAVDLYQAEALWAHVQEYAPPPTIDTAKARTRLREALAVIAQVLDLPQERVIAKVRQRQRGADQYRRRAERGGLLEVREGGLRFLVNLTDYLDTGLFLDHRPTRTLMRELARGRDMLNLFAYTATASVYAAAGEARSTTSVDLSATYLDWARRNLALNGFTGDRHRLLRADCRRWVERQGEGRYGLIFLDPPTFSTSKSMEGTLDVQRDHVELLRATARLLADGGVLIFSNNFRRFTMNAAALPELHIEDISAHTLPRDFARNPRIHNCWRIRRR